MKCPKCHADNPDTSRFCGNCATKLIPGVQPPALTKTLESPVDVLSKGSLVAGKYRVIDEIGRGGMGVVYKAHDTHLGRFVAIKVLPPERLADAERKRRFVQEAKAASALNHPNIIHIYDIDQQQGMDFIAMEYMAGKPLNELIPRKGLRPEDALEYAVQIAGALAKAHAAGIIHRDLKPSNIKVGEDGQVKVLDFGLAKLTEAGGLAEDEFTRTLKAETAEGTILGTVAYMSPEQAEGKKIDARSDIFSFGAVLYEMVTGRRAFQGDSTASTLAAVLKEDPKPPCEVSPCVPRDLEKIILRCLRKEPARRYQTMADLKVALEDAQEESSAAPQVAPARAPSRRRWVWAALLPVLVALGYFAWQAWRAPQPAEPLRAVALTTFPGQELYPSLSPDSNHVTFMWTGPKQDNPDIYVQQIGAGSPLRLTTDPHSDYNPVWSPDGRKIAFLRGESSSLEMQAGKRELLLIPPLGGPERKLAEIRVSWPRIIAPHMAWCPDSNSLVVTDFTNEGKPDALFVVSLETGEKRQLTNPQPPDLGDGNPAVSPDGRSLVFCRHASASVAGLYWLALGTGFTASGEPKRLTPGMLDAAYPAWMPDSKEILFSAKESLWRLAVPSESAPARLPYVGEYGIMPVVSRPQPGRPARLVYVRSYYDENIWRVETSAPGAPSSSPPVVAISSTRVDCVPQFSPDCRRVAFQSSRSGEMEFWLADPDGANAIQLTSMGAPLTGGCAWSPDGRMILFACNAEGRGNIYTIPAGGGKPRRLTSGPHNAWHPSFSRDGKWIYFTSRRTGKLQIWKIPASGGDEVQVTPNAGIRAFESPDGGYIYYNDTSFLAGGLWRLPTSGGEPVKVAEGVVQSAFAVVEKGVYYIDQPAGQARLQFLDFATGKSRTVAVNLGPIAFGLTASPDGRTILYSRVDSSIDDLMLVENFK